MAKCIALTLFVLALPLADRAATTPAIETGFASAYSPGVMERVVMDRYRLDMWRNEPPRDWHDVDGYIAAMDCGRVGQVTTLYGPDGRAYSVLIADCAGADGEPDRFSNLGIIAELDANMWRQLTAAHGRPLKIGLR